MKLTKRITSLTGAAALAVSALATPLAAQAEVSASMAFSNMYLWRGQNISSGSAAISGSLDYSHGSGFYAGAWGSNEGINGSETDLYAGFGGEVSGFSYDISYWWYIYPEGGGLGPDTGLTDTDLSEAVLSLGYGPVSVGIYYGVDTELQGVTGSDYFYYTVGFDFLEKFNLTYGAWSYDDLTKAPATGEYSHITFSYSPLDELTFTISKAMEDGADTLEEDPLFQVTYSKSFDLSGK
ncbi:TorF family putative porin [Kaarinaea lacus]